MNRKPLTFGVIGSVVMLITFFCMQSSRGAALDLPIQYLVASLVPVVVGLLVGGHVKKVKTPIGTLEAALETLPEASQKEATTSGPSSNEWQHQRAGEYARTSGIELAHTYRPSLEEGQLYDIFIYLVRHKRDTDKPPKVGFTEVQHIEFYFGEKWGHEVFRVGNSGGPIGVRTHAFGTFLATARITFTDSKREPVVLHRYIDFEMALLQAATSSTSAQRN